MNIIQSVKHALHRRKVLQKELDQINRLLAPLGDRVAKSIGKADGRKKRGPMSDAARKKLAEVARIRWQKAKAAGKSRL